MVAGIGLSTAWAQGLANAVAGEAFVRDFFGGHETMTELLASSPATLKLKQQKPASPAPGFQWKVKPGALSTNRFMFRPQRLLPAPPKPGVYETRPYTAIVIVPGPHPDDRAIVGSSGGRPGVPMVAPDMPMAVPELRFIPHTAK